MPKKPPGPRHPVYLAERTKWRLAALGDARRWIRLSGEPPHRSIEPLLMRRMDKLETFLRVYFPDAPPYPFDPHDAAGLILLPKRKAARIARILFGRAYQGEDDMPYNTDWLDEPKEMKP